MNRVYLFTIICHRPSHRRIERSLLFNFMTYNWISVSNKWWVAEPTSLTGHLISAAQSTEHLKLRMESGLGEQFTAKYAKATLRFCN